MNIQCRLCAGEFEFSHLDRTLLNRLSPILPDGEVLSLSPPTLCPDCRKQRRLAFRNERVLYRRTSDFSGDNIISVFSPDKPAPVFSYEQWWGDNFDPYNYGRDFDFSRPFFPQFSELLQVVPQMAVVGAQNESCAYCHLTANNRRCYMIVESSDNEDCYHGYWLQKCVQCCDCSFCHECHYSYELQNCYNCYNLKWSSDCLGCHDSYFLDNCQGCNNCIGCVNLQHKEFHLFNEPCSRETFQIFINENLKTRAGLCGVEERVAQLRLKHPRKYMHSVNSENCTGDYINNSSNCYNTFHAHDAEQCRYAEHVWRNSRFNMDVSTAGRDAELIYESINVGISSFNVLFSVQAWSSSDVMYSFGCFSSRFNFGCVGLKHGAYSVLNKRYSENDYSALVKKIVNHMRETKEWGEFFSPEVSQFGYNETVAMESFPLGKAEALILGFQWSDYESPAPKAIKGLSQNNIPESPEGFAGDLEDYAIICESSHRPYKIIPQELEFYRKYGIPIPARHPDVRHSKRLAKRNPQKMWIRDCANCGLALQSTFSPKCEELILCGACYLIAVY